MAVLAALAAASPVTCAPTDPTPLDTTVVYRRARVWNGTGFALRDVAVRGRCFVVVPASAEGEVRHVDLAGRYVIPPFGDAHTHQLEGTSQFARFNAQFLSEGVFYAQNPLGLPRLMRATRRRTDRPETVDATYAMGGISSPFGHPERGFVEFMTQYTYRGETRASLRGTAVHAVKTEADVREAVRIIHADSADFVKVLLDNSEDHAETSARLESIGEDVARLTEFDHAGVDPALVPAVVRHARAAGLRVKAHVTTAHDFRVAVAAGVDEVLHLPGAVPQDNKPLQDYRLTPEDAAAAARRDIPVVATASVRLEVIPPERRAAVFALQRENIRTLMAQGVRVLIGTDSYANTTRTEIDHLRTIGAMSDAELLAAWIATATVIFPDRKLGRIEPGYEASFLVLDADPLTDFTTLDRIAGRIKEGASLMVAEPTAPS